MTEFESWTGGHIPLGWNTYHTETQQTIKLRTSKILLELYIKFSLLL